MSRTHVATPDGKSDRGSLVPIQRTLQRCLVPVLGLASLVWFLVRVVPQPSRAAYPCQRAAFPLASAFVLWLVGVAASTLVGLKARTRWQRSQPLSAGALFALAALLLAVSVSVESPPVSAALYGARNAIFPPEMPAMTRDAAGDSLTVPPSAIVAAVKSVEANATDITFAEISSMVNDAIQRAGGFDGIIADGDTVILKPNLIAAQDFTALQNPLAPEVNGVATDHRVIQATVNAVRAVNPNGTVFLLEGSGVGKTSDNAAIVLWDQVTGLDSLLYLEDVCGDWFDSTSVYLQEVSLPAGKALYNPAQNRYWLNKLYYEADAVISLPVLKNHLCTGTTGAVKNVGIGATPPTFYGCGPTTDVPYERWCQINHGPPYSARFSLHNWIHDFYMCRPVDFVIMDGLQGLQNGPLSNADTPHISEDQMNARLILAGRDPIALDAIAALLCGQDPTIIRHLVTLHNDSLGCVDPRQIRVDGVKVGDEKQSYEITDSGGNTTYSDFTPPSFTVESAYVQGTQLHLRLTVDAQVNKVEVSVDGTYLDQIRLGEFDQFALDLSGVPIHAGSEIVVYAYDQYLNYSSQSPALGTSVAHRPETSPELSVWPNPSRAVTRINYAVKATGDVTLSVFDVQGRLVRTLAQGQHSRGVYEASWNSNGVPTGVYFVRLQAGGEVLSRKTIKVE